MLLRYDVCRILRVGVENWVFRKIIIKQIEKKKL